MANVYARETALNNVVGRSDYISNKERQEDIVFHKKNMEHSWSEYVAFEKENKKSANQNIQARETVIALPNELAKDKKELELFCDRLVEKMYGSNRDNEYAVHWNESRTNLHAHFIYSERERNQERQPKIYKRDIWADSKTGRTCKKDSPNAILRCKKGDLQRDKEGNLKYDNSPFTTKDSKYKKKTWLETRNKLIQDVFNEFEYDISLFDKNAQIAQRKLFKGAQKDYLSYTTEWNIKAKAYNSDFKFITDLKPAVEELQQQEDLIKELTSEKSRLNNQQHSKNFLSKLLSKNPLKVEKLTQQIESLSLSLQEKRQQTAKRFGVKSQESLYMEKLSYSHFFQEKEQSIKENKSWLNNNKLLCSYSFNKNSDEFINEFKEYSNDQALKQQQQAHKKQQELLKSIERNQSQKRSKNAKSKKKNLSRGFDMEW